MRLTAFGHASRPPCRFAGQARLASLETPSPLRCQTRILLRVARRQHSQLDAIDRAGRQAALATVALGCDDGVHLLGSAHDRIHRAGLDAQRAADALLLAYKRYGRWSSRFTQGQHRPAGQTGEQRDDALATRRALVYGHLAPRATASA